MTSTPTNDIRAVLEPFAEMAASWHEHEPDSTIMDYHDEDGAMITLGD